MGFKEEEEVFGFGCEGSVIDSEKWEMIQLLEGRGEKCRIMCYFGFNNLQ